MKVVYLGHRAPIYPAANPFDSQYSRLWLWSYGSALLAAYLTLEAWWLILPSYLGMFYTWMVIVPIGTAFWGASQKKSWWAVALTAGAVAWLCDIIVFGISES